MANEGGPNRPGVSDQSTIAQSATSQAPDPESTRDAIPAELRGLPTGLEQSELTPAALARISAAVGHAESPRTIGRYRLIEILGRGGMGEVWRAEQEQPIRRTVAIKLIKLGMDTREIIARFEAERQALAMMNHPNVAKVLDAGATDTGRPYFVMEYVPGEPITNFCDRQACSLGQRLQLFLQACAAIAHAHQKGILHRDLKPGNILVTAESGEPQVKVIDFGVAKALQPEPGRQTLLTMAGQIIGTPEYMPPEQALSDGRDVDTRSDIYSLGVVLYELLSGVLPFDPKALRGSGLEGIQRMIRDVDPPRPSTRLSSLQADEVATIAQRRHIQVGELKRQLKRELEWIPLKAMRKEPAMRYVAALEFAQDIENYLQQRPLLAGPESRRYRLRKFARRNKVAVIIAALFAFLLAASAAMYVHGVGVEQRKTLVALGEAEGQRALAEKRENETARVANFQGLMLSDINLRLMGNRLRNDIVDEAAKGWKRAGLPPQEVAARQAQLEGLLKEANFTNPAVQTLNRSILERSVAAAHEKLADQPLVLASVLQQIARTRSNLRLLNEAIAPQADALEIRRTLPDGHPDKVESINGLGWLLDRKGDWDQAERLAREALTTRRRAIGGGDDRLTLGSLRLLADTVQEQGRLEEAEQYHRESEQASRQILPRDDPEQLDAILRLGQLLLWERKLDEAEPLIQEALDRMGRSAALGENHWRTIGARVVHGTLRNVQGKLADAESDYQKCLQLYRVMEGDDHRDSLFVLTQLGGVLRKQERLPEAETHLANALEGFRRAQADDTDKFMVEEQMAMLRQSQRQWDDAERLFADLYDRAPSLKISPPAAARFMSGYGTFLAAMARYDEAEKPLLQAYKRLKQTEQDRHERMRDVVEALADVYDHTNRPEEAAQRRAELAKLRAATQAAH